MGGCGEIFSTADQNILSPNLDLQNFEFWASKTRKGVIFGIEVINEISFLGYKLFVNKNFFFRNFFVHYPKKFGLSRSKFAHFSLGQTKIGLKSTIMRHFRLCRGLSKFWFLFLDGNLTDGEKKLVSPLR